MAVKKLNEQGFTLIEILVAIAIVAIVAAVAIPSYSRYMNDTRRIDAISFLAEVAGEQTRFFTDNNRYAETMSELGYGTADTHDSPEGHYNISIANAVATSFTLTAAPVAGSPQMDDTNCGSLSLDSTGLKAATGPGGVANCW
jgi:type IV pilus assembly protein PilE